MDGGGDEAVGKRVAVVGAENALLLSRIVAEAPEEEMMKGFELVELVGLGQGASIEVTATGNRGYLHL